jgi:tetratricopeptide (TPR) repeat protein
VRTTLELREILGGRYLLEGELGTGGQGTVFRARDRQLGRAVAVKFLRPEVAPLLGADRFQREIAIAASLSHPNIVPLLDSGGEAESLYYTMPLVEGESLRARLRRQPQLPFDDALAITRDVAAAIDYAHGRGYLHRDIKPENIMVSGDRAFVLDFGIARAIEVAGEEAITSGTIVIGTPMYMSPEQASGQKQLDGGTDIYALGCVLYEMLAGVPPFTGATPQAIIARHLVDRPPALSTVRPAIPPAVEEVVGKALAKVPADRHRSAAELVRELETAPSSPAGARSGRRWRWSLAAGAIGLAGLGGWLAWPGATLDANKVMGFPLLQRGGVPAFEVEQVEEAVAAAMQDTEPLRWLRARLFLGAEARGGLTADSATRVARLRGARYWLGGSIAAVGDSLIVRLELFDAQGDSLVASRAEAGTRETPAYALAFRAVNLLLPRIVGRSTHVAEKYLERHPPAAVAKWLAGEVAYRNARYRDALTLYRQALGTDSTLVPAALKGAMTAAWLLEYGVGDSLVTLALRHEDGLPPVNRLLARGLAHQFAGQGDSAAHWFRRAVEADPTWSEAWYQVGDAAYHLWPDSENLDSVARDAFLRSTRADPDFAPVVFHLAELAIAAGDLVEAGSLVARHRRLSADSIQQLQLDLMLRCARGASAEWPALAARDTGGSYLLTAGRLLAAGGRNLACAEAAYGAALASPLPDPTVGRRWNAALGLHHVFVARGEHRRARALADSVAASGVPAGRGLQVVDALLGVGPESAGAAEMAALEAPLDNASVARLWWFGQWSAAQGDTPRLEAVVRRLRYRAALSGSLRDAVPARAMAARLLLARGDTASAIDSLRALRPAAPLGQLIWGYWESLAPERLLLARLLLARGSRDEAARVAASFDGQRSAADVAFLPQSLALRRAVGVKAYHGARSGFSGTAR